MIVYYLWHNIDAYSEVADSFFKVMRSIFYWNDRSSKITFLLEHGLILPSSRTCFCVEI